MIYRRKRKDRSICECRDYNPLCDNGDQLYNFNYILLNIKEDAFYEKGFGWFLAAAALLTPYAAEKNEETGEYEIRSLLLRVKTKTVTDDDGTEHRDCTVNFAGLPTRGDVETIRQNVSGGIAKVSAGISKCAKRVSDAFKDSCFAKRMRTRAKRTSVRRKILKISSTTSRKREAKRFDDKSHLSGWLLN